MKTRSLKALFLVALSGSFLLSCYQAKDNDFVFVAVRLASGVDEKFIPQGITDTFATGTAKVYCWFQWRDAPKDTKILAHWHYVTDDISILDYAFSIPRKNGSGSVSLEMPQGKALPNGAYRVDLLQENKKLQTLLFTVGT